MAQDNRTKITIEDLKKSSSNQKVKLTAKVYTFAEDTFQVYNLTQTIKGESRNIAVIPMKGDNGKVQDVPLRYFCTRSFIDNTHDKELREIKGFCEFNDLVECYELLEKAFADGSKFTTKLETYLGLYNETPYATFIQSLIKSE